jgi:hypothetical protein
VLSFATALEKYDGCSLLPPRSDRRPQLLVMVLSACNNVERRGLVRAMMQREKFTNYKFLLGNCTGSDEEHGDLVHANLTDTYHTSSAKLLLGMEVMLRRWDFEWLMKIDDDVLVRFTPLLQGLTRMPRVLCRDDGATSVDVELPLWWAAFRRGAPSFHVGGRNAVNFTAVQPHLVNGQWPLFGFGSGHVLNRGAVHQIVQAKEHWMEFAERSGVWMEDVAFGIWFDSLKQSCRIHDPEFTQYCAGENSNIITEVDGLVRNPADDCVVPHWVLNKPSYREIMFGTQKGRDPAVPKGLGPVICGTTAEALAGHHVLEEQQQREAIGFADKQGTVVAMAN